MQLLVPLIAEFFFISDRTPHHGIMSPVPEALQKVFGYIDEHKDKFIDNLAEAVEIKSVSAW